MDTAHSTAIPWAFGNRNLQGLHHSETLVSAFTTMTWTYNSYKNIHITYVTVYVLNWNTALFSTEYVYDDRTIPNHILQKLLMNALNTLCREDTSTVHSIPPLTQITLMHVWVASWARLAAPYDSDFMTWTLSMNKTVDMIMSWWVVHYSDVTMDSVTSQTTLVLIVC